MTLERGTLLNNRYRIMEILGQGGMGSVFRALDENLGVEVAVKDNLFTTEEYARQFRLEATILATLRHSNLPRVTDHFVISGQGQYLVMDYIEGEDLRQRMERVGPIPEDEVVTIGAAVCDALTYLSSRNPPIIHRDIKPGNVRITPQGQIFLVDFGLAKTLRGSQATTTGARAMTPGFSPPEQYGTARTDQRSDIFSLGATLYAALAGSIPEDALARAMDQAELTPMRKYNPRISRRLATSIERALEVRPDDRYQTAEEFKQALLNTNTSNKQKEGEYIVPPAPEELTVQPSQSATATPGLDGTLAPPQERTPQIFPGSASLEEAEKLRPRSRPRKRTSRRGCWLVLLVAVALLAGTGAVIYTYYPKLPSQAIAQIWPMIVEPASTSTYNLASTSTEPVIGVTTTPPINSFSATFTPVAKVSRTPTITSMPSSTNTPVLTDTPTPLPTAIGGSGCLAFASRSTGTNQINTINVDGTGQRRITDMPEGACQPRWSPDGKRLVFISPCSIDRIDYLGSAMYIINVDGSGLLPLPTVAGGDYDPAWSPDGTSIAFTSIRNIRRPQIYILNLLDNTVTALSEPYSFDRQPSWSRDGKQILFVSNRRGILQVWVMDADGKNQKQFSHSAGLLDYYPVWSPDGKLVLFTQYASESGVPWVSLAPYVFENYQEYRITQEPFPMREAVFSPDGYWVAFEGWSAGGSHDIYLVAVSGAGRRDVTTDPAVEFDPDWCPLP